MRRPWWRGTYSRISRPTRGLCMTPRHRCQPRREHSKIGSFPTRPERGRRQSSGCWSPCAAQEFAMRADQLFSDPSLAATVAAATERLPSPAPEDSERLRATLEGTERAPTEAQWPPILETPRQKKDTRYADPPTSHRPVVGPALV